VFVVQLTATSAAGTSLPQALAINIAPADSVPVITSPNFASGTVGANFSYQITASNPPLLTLDAVNLAPGLAVNPATGLIQGRPTSVGTFTATLVGTNAAGSGPFRELTIEIQPALAAPVITLLGGAVVPARVGLAFSYQIRASNSPTSYEVLGAPEWMTINGASGALGGTPTEPGTVTMQLLARNATGASRPVALSLNVAAAPGAPVITSSRTAMGFVGAQFSYRITATNNPSGFRVRGLPAGLVFDSITGVISGRPSASGVFKITLGARNASGLGDPAVLVLVVSPNLRLVLPGF